MSWNYVLLQWWLSQNKLECLSPASYSSFILYFLEISCLRGKHQNSMRKWQTWLETFVGYKRSSFLTSLSVTRKKSFYVILTWARVECLYPASLSSLVECLWVRPEEPVWVKQLSGSPLFGRLQAFVTNIRQNLERLGQGKNFILLETFVN
jgi:hypothetical protein